MSALTGLLTYLFLALLARFLVPDEFGKFFILWSAVYLLSGAFLSAFEPEASRIRTLGTSKEATALILVLSLFLLIILSAFIVAFLTDTNFALGSTTGDLLVPPFIVFSFAFQLLLRGFLAGTDKPSLYSLIAVTDATLRMLLLLLASLLEKVNPLSVGLILAVSSVSAGFLALYLLGINLQQRLQFPSLLDFREELFRVLSIAGGMLSLALLISGVPIAVKLLLSPSLSEIAVLGATVSITRVPILLLAGFESVLVPSYHTEITKSRPNTIRIVRKFSGILLVLLLAVILLSSAIGSLVVALLFGDAYSPDRLPIAFFGGATVFIMGGLILSPIFLVEKKHWLISVTWTVGALVFLISLSLHSGDAILAAARSLFIATAVSYLLQYNLIIRAIKK